MSIEMTKNIVTEELIKKILNQEGTISELDVKDLCSQGENYTANLLDVKFKFTKDGGSEAQYNFVLKYPNEESFMYQAGKMMNLYRKETLMYSKLIPNAINWQQKQFGKVMYAAPAPKLLYCDEENDIIVIENLRESDYIVEPRQIGKNYEQCKAVMKSLAEFHAIMLAYLQSFETEDDFFELYPYARITDKAIYQNILEPPNALEQKRKLLDPILNVLKSAVPEKDKVFDKYSKHVLSEAIAKNAYMSILPNAEFNVICHGDLWNNNVMFLNELTGSVKNCKFIDFQLYKYCTPSADVGHFLWMSASTDVIRDHRIDLLKLYYEVLNTAMNDMKGSVQFSIEDLLRHFEESYDFGLQFAVTSAVIMFASKEKAVSANVRDADENPMVEFAKQIDKFTENIDKNALQRIVSLIELGEHLNIY